MAFHSNDLYSVIDVSPMGVPYKYMVDNLPISTPVNIEDFQNQEVFEQSVYDLCRHRGCKSTPCGNYFKGNSGLCKKHLDEKLEEFNLQKTK